MTIRLPDAIEGALRATGLPWQIERGRKHAKLWLAGRLVGVCPGKGHGTSQTAERNVVAQIRRAARQASDRVRA